MTIPWLMNCGHNGDGWCLDCVKRQHAELEAAEARVAELEGWISQDGLSVLIEERDRYRAALEIIADPSTACMSWSETVHCLRAHARNALKG